MITFDAVKLFLSKAWIFIKKFWAWIVIGFMTVGVLVFLKNKSDQFNKLFDDYKKQSDDFHKELNEVQQAYETERVRQQRIEVTYQQVVVRLEQERQQAVVQLDNQKKDQLRQIVTETHNDPDEMARRINTLFGIPINN